jgi:hypothetical protein
MSRSRFASQCGGEAADVPAPMGRRVALPLRTYMERSSLWETKRPYTECKLSTWSLPSVFAMEFVAEKSLAASEYGRVPTSE